MIPIRQMVLPGLWEDLCSVPSVVDSAATGLARLWQSQGKRQDAYELLNPIYGWFTEGFDTANLLEATQLLDELSAEMKPPTA